MKFYVYCLVSVRDVKFHYYGFTTDINKRLIYHNRGKVRTTNRYKPLNLLGYVEFESKSEALKYEKKLKGSCKEREKLLRMLGSPCLTSGR